LKNKIVLLCLILLSGVLFACNSEKATFVFVGTIEEIHGESATVFVPESKESKISGTVVIGLHANTDDTFQVGDKVRVGYDGNTMETAPVGVHALTIEKVE
jgi:hypothetical protein